MRARLLSVWLVCSLLLACGGDRPRPVDAGADVAVSDDAPLGVDAPAPCPDSLVACAYPPLGLAQGELTGLTSTHEAIGRTVPLVVRHPTAPGRYPVVFFEHGGGLRSDGHTDSAAWGRVIASHGYVVVHVGHVETGGMEQSRALCMLGGVTDEECLADPAIIHTVARPVDLLAAIDDLGDVAAAVSSATGGAVDTDTSRIGLVGWSGGTHGPITIFGAGRRLTATTTFTRADPRPLVAVLLSPAGSGFHHFFHDAGGHSWEALRGPTLVITGDDDVKPEEPELVGPIRREPFDLAPADGTHRLLYSHLPEGVGAHGTYNLGDRESTDPRLLRLSGAMVSLTLAHLDAHLRDDAAAVAYVESDRALLLAGDAEYLRR